MTVQGRKVPFTSVADISSHFNSMCDMIGSIDQVTAFVSWVESEGDLASSSFAGVLLQLKNLLELELQRINGVAPHSSVSVPRRSMGTDSTRMSASINAAVATALLSQQRSKALKACCRWLEKQYKQANSKQRHERRSSLRRRNKKLLGRFLEKEDFNSMSDQVKATQKLIERQVQQQPSKKLTPELAVLYERCYVQRLLFNIGQQRSSIITLQDVGHNNSSSSSITPDVGVGECSQQEEDTAVVVGVGG
jgi:hypothetical protein